MKIGLIANAMWNIYNFRIPLIQALVDQGNEVYAIAPKDEYSQLIKEKGISIIHLNNLDRKGTNPLRDIRLTIEIRSLIKNLDLDVVLLYTIKPNIYGTFAASISKCASICTVTGLGYTFINRTISARIAHKLYKWAFRRADYVLFQNSDDQQLFGQMKLIGQTKTEIVPGSGIDAGRFNRQVREGENEVFTFLFVGRLLRDKGVFELIEAAGQLELAGYKFQLNLVGDIDVNNPASIVQAEIDRIAMLNKSIKFLGKKEDVYPEYAKADCVVLPSYREGLPRVLLEAMSMQLPIVCTDVPGCRETVVDGENGFLAEVQNAEDLFRKMEKMMKLNDEERKSMGQIGRQMVLQRYDKRIIIDHYLRLLEQISI